MKETHHAALFSGVRWNTIWREREKNRKTQLWKPVNLEGGMFLKFYKVMNYSDGFKRLMAFWSVIMGGQR